MIEIEVSLRLVYFQVERLKYNLKLSYKCVFQLDIRHYFMKNSFLFKYTHSILLRPWIRQVENLRPLELEICIA